MDLDLRIQITDLWIRILLFMEVADKMPTKNNFFFKVFFEYISVFKDKKSKRSHKIVKSRVFLLFCMLMVSMVFYVDFCELFILWVGSSGRGWENHRVHRVATVPFWRTFDHEGNICPGWWGWLGARPSPFTTFTITSKVAVYTPAEWALGQIH